MFVHRSIPRCQHELHPMTSHIEFHVTASTADVSTSATGHEYHFNPLINRHLTSVYT